MPPLTHTHQYIRVGTSKSKQFMCAHSECSHVISKKLLKGKKSICNKCSSEFNLDSYALKAAKPICERCRETKRIEHTVDISKVRPKPAKFEIEKIDNINPFDRSKKL